MSEWLGKPRITEKDIEEYQPMITKYFPALTKYFIDNQKFRVSLILDWDFADKFREVIKKEYGSINPINVRQAVQEALELWIKSKSK
ncbi:MAG: hypothetical protein HWN66_08935 [Candidatus Helarchaeota archaeon]|nr:hypothetical protein [Candidatus Helarchaeota archaeon]